MNKPEGRKMIKVSDLDATTGVILYTHIEAFDKSPLRGLMRKYVPQAKDRIYIYPESNIPRFKLKRFCENYKVAVAKAKETATVFFMNPEVNSTGLAYYYSEHRPTIIQREYFMDYLKKATKIGDARYTQLLIDLENSLDSYVYLEDDRTFENTGINNYKLNVVQKDDLDEDDDGNVDESLTNCEEMHTIYYIETQEQRDMFTQLIGKDFYHPDALLALLNEGSVLDKELYDGIMNLFQSKDEADHKVAMEAMSNCDYQKSAVYLLMTFYHNRQTIYNCDTRNHVNFKSFLNYFDLKASNHISIDDIVDKLKDKRILDSTNLAIVMKEARKIVISAIECSTQHFTFTEIVPTAEVQKEVEETDAEIAAELVAIPEPVVTPEPVIEIPESAVVPVMETPEIIDEGGLSHL